VFIKKNVVRWSCSCRATSRLIVLKATLKFALKSVTHFRDSATGGRYIGLLYEAHQMETVNMGSDMPSVHAGLSS
jgi:hypothetical protein